MNITKIKTPLYTYYLRDDNSIDDMEANPHIIRIWGILLIALIVYTFIGVI